MINRRELQKTLRKYENYTFFHHTKILLFRMSVTRSFFTLCEYINTISTVHIMLLPGQKPSSYPLLKFVYVTSQLRHSIVVHHHHLCASALMSWSVPCDICIPFPSRLLISLVRLLTSNSFMITLEGLSYRNQLYIKQPFHVPATWTNKTLLVEKVTNQILDSNSFGFV